MHEGLRWRALRDPNPGDGESPVEIEWQRRSDANGFGDSRCGPVGHQLPRHPAHVLRSVSIFNPATISGKTLFLFRNPIVALFDDYFKVCKLNYVK